MYDMPRQVSYKPKRPARRAVTVRVPADRLSYVMRARRVATQSELINTLLTEEEERLRSHRAIRATAGKLNDGDLDDRLL